ncbi:MAG TPA: hypothetical protein VN660_04995 [Steroidobacteraceae bacterium]|nr:hypothetical protein [Steroidobacteraceae bacterium]
MFRIDLRAALRVAAVPVVLACFPPHLHAQVPAAVAASNRATGGHMSLAEALRLYAQQEERAPYRGVRVERDVRYGPDAHQRLDLFMPQASIGPKVAAAAPSDLRPVVMFAAPEADTRASLGSARRAYDNVALWAARQGLIGVTMHRRDDGAYRPGGPQDFAAAIAWMQMHLRHLGADPRRLVVIGAGLGGTQLLHYLAHHEYWCCQGPGVAAAVLLGAPLNLAPLVPAGKAVVGHSHPMATATPAPAALMDPAHSDLSGLDAVYAPVFIGVPQYQDDVAQRSATILQQELCRRGRCPTVRYLSEHSVISAVLSLDTADQSVSRQLLAWMAQQQTGFTGPRR